MSIIQLFEDRLQTAVHDWVKQGAAPPEKSVRLSGVLYLSASGWLLLSVPNALVRGAFSALNEPGVELPLRDGKLNAHITVFRPEEIEQVGGQEKFLKDRVRTHLQRLKKTAKGARKNTGRDARKKKAPGLSGLKAAPSRNTRLRLVSGVH